MPLVRRGHNNQDANRQHARVIVAPTPPSKRKQRISGLANTLMGVKKETDVNGDGDDPEGLQAPHHHGGSGGMFVDASTMKEQMRADMSKPKYDVSMYYHPTGRAQAIARHFVFEGCTLAVISLNALWISIDTDLNDSPTLLESHPVFQVAENLFCLYFFIELLIRFFSFKNKLNCCRDAWFVFDSCLVITMVLETWVMTAIILFTGSAGGAGLGNASILRMARLLRLTRMARMARLLRAMPELMILIKGMVAGMRSVMFTLFLLLVIIYVFAIAFRQLSGEVIGELYFKNIPRAMATLLHRCTFMDEFVDLADDVADNQPALLILLYMFVLVASLTLMNMLIGVLVDVVQAVASTEKEALTLGYVKEKIMFIMKAAGLDVEDNDVLISRKEFMSLLANPLASRTFLEVDVDPLSLVDAADFIFHSDEFDEFDHPVDKQLSFADLMEVVLALRGTNTATVRDIADLRKFIQKENKSMKKKSRTRGNGTLINKARTMDLGALMELDEKEIERIRTEQLATSGSMDSLASNASTDFDPPASFDIETRGLESEGRQKTECTVYDSEDNNLLQNATDDIRNLLRRLETVSSSCALALESPLSALSPRPQRGQLASATLPRAFDTPIQAGPSDLLKGQLKPTQAAAKDSAFQSRAETSLRKCVQELEDQHERALAALRSDNSRLADELSKTRNAYRQVPDNKVSPSSAPHRKENPTNSSSRGPKDDDNNVPAFVEL